MTTPRRSIAMSTGTAVKPTRAKMDIGDEVIAEVNQTRYTGVLRHLGPVHFRPGIFAGLELTGSSAGKGKNDGSVDGQQYFACAAGDGMFCPSSKVQPSGAAPSKEATARPQSALSNRSSTHADDQQSRPRSSLSIAESDSSRPRSSLANNAARTPSRPSAARPTSAFATPTPAGRLPRLLPRKSVADGLADEEGRRRAKTSAEEAAKAEGRITEGSRAHRYLNMSAKDLEARRLRARPSSPEKSTNGGTASPLKESLLGPARTPKVRASIGGSALPTASAGSGLLKTPTASTKPTIRTLNAPPTTPSAARSRSSMSDMPPPPPSAWRLTASNVNAKTPRRLSADSGRSNSRNGQTSDVEDEVKVRNRGLLEQMDLLTPRHAKAELPADDDEVFGDPDGAIRSSSAVAEAVVPLSLYEEVNTENNELKMQLDDLNKKLEQGAERARVAAQQEARKEMEEERRVEREDDQRRRKTEQDDLLKEWQAKEETWKKDERTAREQLDNARSELRKLQDEHDRAKVDHDKTKEEMDLRLRDSHALVDKLKAAAETDDEAQAKAQAKTLELTQLHERIQRLEDERQALLKEIDELKDAGQETMDIYEREQATSNERIAQLENNMHLLEAHAQEAIASAIQERDEALQQRQRGVVVGAGGDENTSVEAIDRQSLEEQLSQSQRRNETLEDQLNELTTALHEEREAHVKRKDGYGEREAKLKAEVMRWKGHVKLAEQSQRDSRQRVDMLEDALEESRTRLENERAELETLRAEAMIAGDTSDGGQARQTLEMNGLRSIVNTLNQELTELKKNERELRKQVEVYKTERRRLSQESIASPAARTTSTLNGEENGELEQSLREAESHLQQMEQRLAEAEKSKREEMTKLNQDIAELEALCEATVWRREEQEARRQELERKVGKLQRQVERLQQSTSQSANGAPPPPIPSLPKEEKGTSNMSSKTLPAVPSTTTLEPSAQHSRPLSASDNKTNASEVDGTTLSASSACVECNEHGHTIDDCPYLNDDVLF